MRRQWEAPPGGMDGGGLQVAVRAGRAQTLGPAEAVARERQT